MARYTETDILLGVAVGIVILGAWAGKASGAPRPGAPASPAPVPGSPTPAEKAAAGAMVLEPGRTYEAIIKTPPAVASFVNEQTVRDTVLRELGMVVQVAQVDSTHWLVRGVWVGPRTPITALPPEVDSIREAS